jgi:septal ring-binding cell division protein DamX
LNEAGVKVEDVKAVELKSDAEEDADKTVTEDSKLTDEEKLKKLMEESKSRLSNELDKFKDTPAAGGAAATAAPAEGKVEVAETKNPEVGKFTIQLGSYNTMEEAKQFAEGFTVRGYSPILNEVKIDGKGKWYRVSLGLFKTVEEAKAYIKNEQSLFSGQDHIITEIR